MGKRRVTGRPSARLRSEQRVITEASSRAMYALDGTQPTRHPQTPWIFVFTRAHIHTQCMARRHLAASVLITLFTRHWKSVSQHRQPTRWQWFNRSRRLRVLHALPITWKKWPCKTSSSKKRRKHSLPLSRYNHALGCGVVVRPSQISVPSASSKQWQLPACWRLSK